MHLHYKVLKLFWQLEFWVTQGIYYCFPSLILEKLSLNI